MDESPKKQEDLAEEFRNLGKNLVEAMRAAWESPERRRLQQEIETGLTELGTTLSREVNSFNESPTGQRLKSNVQEAQQRIRSREVESKVREELLSALQTVNAELQKVTDRLSAERSAGATKSASDEKAQPDYSPDERREVHPDDVTAPPAQKDRTEVHPDDVDSGISTVTIDKD